MHREDSGALTVPCSIHGQSGRLLVDTGGFVTTFPETFFNRSGSPLNQRGYRRASLLEQHSESAPGGSMT